DKYQEAARYLKELKNGQRSLDDYPRRCEAAARELQDKVRVYIDNQDPRGLEDVPRLAREYGRVGKEALEQAERKKYEMGQWRDRAAYFSDSDGKWSDVGSYLQSAVSSIWSEFQKPYDQIKRDDVCGYLAKDEQNPVATDALSKLSEGGKGRDALIDLL